MSVERIEFELTTEIDDRLKAIEDQGGSKNMFCIRSVGVAHYVMSKLANECLFYQGDRPLPLPEAKQNKKLRLGRFMLKIPTEYLQEFEDVCFHYAIDYLSVLEWGIACVDAMNEAVLLNGQPIFARGKGKNIQLDLSWFH